MKKTNEHRRWARIPAKIAVTLKRLDRPKKSYTGEILNISPGGAFVRCEKELPVGVQVQVTIRFHEATLLEAKVIDHEMFFNQGHPVSNSELSTIRWAQTHPHGGFGIEFVKLKGESQEFIKTLLRYFHHLEKAGVSFVP